MKPLVLAVCVFLFEFNPSDVHCDGARVLDRKYPLLYSDLIVEGVVRGIKEDVVLESEFIPLPPKMKVLYHRIYDLEFAIIRVLKGDYSGNDISIVIHRGMSEYYGDFSIGDTLILCTKFLESLRGGSYYLKESLGKYRLVNGKWISKPDTWDEYTVPYDEIRSTIRSGAIDSVVDKADFIIRGTVIGIDTTQYVDSRGIKIQIQEPLLSVAEVLKGTISGNAVRIKMVFENDVTPTLLQKMPIEVHLGEDWLLFLKNGVVGYYPFANINGMYRIKGDRLLYDNHLEYHLSANDVKRIISKGKE